MDTDAQSVYDIRRWRSAASLLGEGGEIAAVGDRVSRKTVFSVILVKELQQLHF